MKLEFKHLQNYPMNEDNGIKIQTCTRIASEQGEKMGYKVGTLIGISARTDVEILFDKDDFSEDYDLDQIKPILRPMSDLTKEIEFNGEKIIPLKELLELHEDDELDQYKPYKYAQNDGVYGVKFTDIQGFECSFAYHENLLMFGVMVIDNKRPAWTYRQLELFEKLFEWHFDVYGLIEEKLAINIHEL